MRKNARCSADAKQQCYLMQTASWTCRASQRLSYRLFCHLSCIA